MAHNSANQVPRKIYLGDSVYGEADPYGGIVLTTDNGLGPSNTIYLEPEVYEALTQWVGARTRSNLDRLHDSEAPGG